MNRVETQDLSGSDSTPPEAVRRDLFLHDGGSELHGWRDQNRAPRPSGGQEEDERTDEDGGAAPVKVMPSKTGPKTAFELLEEVWQLLEGEGGVLAVLEEPASRPDMMREGAPGGGAEGFGSVG